MNEQKQWYKQGKHLAMEMQTTSLSDDELALWFLGQCGFALKKDDHLILIDPVLNDLKDPQGNTRRLFPSGLDPAKLKVDLVLITHGHRDHMAIETLQKLARRNPDLRIVVPTSCKPALMEAGIDEKIIVPLNHHQEYHPWNIDIRAFRTAHPTYELAEGEAERSIGYEIEAGDIRIVHPGDTYMTPELEKEFTDMEDVSIFMPPINGSDYWRTKRGCIGNFNPFEAAMAASLLRADLSIPTHYDMMSGNTCSPYPFLMAMDEVWPKKKSALPHLGERMIYKR